MSSFTVTTAGEKIQLDGTGAGKAQYTVTNTSSATLEGRLLAVPQDPAKAEWFSIDGEPTREFAPGGAERVVVEVRAPLGTPPATYSFRLDAVSEAAPDEDFTEGPTVSFDVSLPAPPVPWWKKYWWIWVIAGVVLLAIIGVVVWLVLRGSSKPGFDPSRLSVVAGATSSADVNAVTSVDTSCPVGQVVISGGWSTTDWWVTQTNGPLGTSQWRVSLQHWSLSGSAPQTQTPQLLCYSPQSGFNTSGLSVVAGADQTAAVGGLAQFDASCPAGQLALDGGYSSSSSWGVQTIAPTSTTSWHYSLYALGPSTVRSQLICWAPPSGFDATKLSVVHGAPHDVATMTTGAFDESCPAAQHVLSGGYTSTSIWGIANDGPISTTTWRVGLWAAEASTQTFTIDLLCYAG